jgi:hypothetical protein
MQLFLLQDKGRDLKYHLQEFIFNKIAQRFPQSFAEEKYVL